MTKNAFLLFLTGLPAAAYAGQEPTTAGQQIAEHKVAISVGIGVFIVGCLLLVSLVRAMYRKAAEYGLRGFKCWQFGILATCSLIAWPICIVMFVREAPADAIFETFAVFLAPSAVIAAVGNIRQSNVPFGLAWTLLQVVQAYLICLVIVLLLLKLGETKKD